MPGMVWFMLNVTIVVQLAGCKLLGPDDNLWACAYDDDPCVLVPLAVGNYWDYILYGGDGTVRDSLDRKEISYARDFRIEGDSIHAYRLGSVAIALDQMAFAANLQGGLYKIGLVKAINPDPMKVLAFPFPAQVGDTGTMIGTWREDRRDIVGPITVELVDLFEWIETQAGIFRTIVYKYRHPPPFYKPFDGHNYVYFRPGLAPISHQKTMALDRKDC